MKYKNEFKNIDTQEKAYVLGLYYADGYVYKGKKYSYFSGITLHKKDGYIIDQIVDLFPFMYKDTDKSKPTTFQLRCNYKKFCKHLISHGLLQKKSFENKLLLRFPDIPEELHSHFIRGFFDGDGSTYFSKTSSPNSKYCTFCGVCHNFLYDIQKILVKEGIEFRDNIRDQSKYTSVLRGDIISGSKDMMTLIISDRESITNFGNYLYKDANIYFKRKRKIIEKWFELFKPRKKCKSCNSLNTVYHRDDYIECRDCGEYSVVGREKFKPMKSKQCKHCGSLQTVGHGKTRSRTDNRIISQNYLCKKCNRNSSYPI